MISHKNVEACAPRAGYIAAIKLRIHTLFKTKIYQQKLATLPYYLPVHCTVYSVYSILYTLYTVQCIQYTVHMYIIHCCRFS
jgi:hypothetical protein